MYTLQVSKMPILYFEKLSWCIAWTQKLLRAIQG